MESNASGQVGRLEGWRGRNEGRNLDVFTVIHAIGRRGRVLGPEIGERCGAGGSELCESLVEAKGFGTAVGDFGGVNWADERGSRRILAHGGAKVAVRLLRGLFLRDDFFGAVTARNGLREGLRGDGLAWGGDTVHASFHVGKFGFDNGEFGTELLRCELGDAHNGVGSGSGNGAIFGLLEKGFQGSEAILVESHHGGARRV